VQFPFIYSSFLIEFRQFFDIKCVYLICLAIQNAILFAPLYQSQLRAIPRGCFTPPDPSFAVEFGKFPGGGSVSAVAAAFAVSFNLIGQWNGSGSAVQ
jgi:hypothetical protein